METGFSDNDSDNEIEEAQRNVNVLEGFHEKLGYLDGFDSGKEAKVQEGFNFGFPVGAEIGVDLGKLRGKLDTILLLELSDIPATARERLYDLNNRIQGLAKNGKLFENGIQSARDALQNMQEEANEILASIPTTEPISKILKHLM